MDSTVYLNPNFVPNNQKYFYRNDVNEYIKNQEEMNMLILKKLKRQNGFIINQYYELHNLILTSHEQYLNLKNEQDKLRNSIQSMSENNSYALQQVKDKLDTTSTKVDRIPMKLKNHLENSMSTSLKNSQEQIIDRIFTKLEEVTGNFTSYLSELGKQSFSELFIMLNPGTKVNSLVVSGAIIQVATFIHFDKETQQVMFRMNDGNLLIANCSNIEAVEINTQKPPENIEEV